MPRYAKGSLEGRIYSDLKMMARTNGVVSRPHRLERALSEQAPEKRQETVTLSAYELRLHCMVLSLIVGTLRASGDPVIGEAAENLWQAAEELGRKL